MRNLLSLSYIMKCALDILFLYFIFQHKEKFKTFFGNPFNLLKITVVTRFLKCFAMPQFAPLFFQIAYCQSRLPCHILSATNENFLP